MLLMVVNHGMSALVRFFSESRRGESGEGGFIPSGLIPFSVTKRASSPLAATELVARLLLAAVGLCLSS